MSSFSTLGVPQGLIDVLAAQGIDTPTPIQTATLPDSFAGKDVLGRGRTGSGKTFAFLLPVVARLGADRRRPVPKRPRALILAPTRELASQIEESLVELAATERLSHLTIFGGVKQNPQVRALASGVDILVACPGRLLDLMGQRAVSLDDVEVTVLDEADHMADMGFLPMVKRILDKTPTKGQRMLFSATLDNGIGVIVERYLHNPVVHEADSAESPVSTMEHHIIEVGAKDKGAVLLDLAAAPGRTIFFTRTKYGAKKLAKSLLMQGIPAVELHGNLAQNARTRNLDAFHSGRVTTLVATDIAARGIHVDDVELVVHADPPTEHKAYLHRSGRTARAGKEGTVVTLVTPEQRQEVRALMRAAKIHPTAHAGDQAGLAAVAPGERSFLSPAEAEKAAYPDKPAAQPQRPHKSGAARNPSSGRATSRGKASGAGKGAKPTTSAGTGKSPKSASRKASSPRGVAAAGSTKGAAGFSRSAGRRSR
ncbi:MAG: DEAD/DEAH box helicase [Propionibacteriaceae bacterium]